MKKYLLTFAMGLLLALALAPAAFAANQDTTDLQNTIDGVNAPSAAISLMNMAPNNVDNMTFAAHEGGQGQ